jgi:branched-chain amino acid transport system substrate-binding protein
MRLWAVTFLLLSLTSLHAAQKPVVKVGVIAPLSGTYAAYGEEIRGAMLMAHRDFKSVAYDYKLVFEDDQMTPNMTAVAAQKLINLDRVNALLTVGSPPGNVVSPLAEKAKVLHISLASDPNIAKGKLNFTHNTDPENEATVLVNELARRKIKSISMIEMQGQGWLAIGNAVEKHLKNKEITLTSRTRYSAGERNFRSIISKILSEKPEMLYIVGFSPEIDLLKKQIDESQSKIPVTSIDGFELSASSELYENLWFVGCVPLPEALSKRLANEYQISKTHYIAGLAYDMLMLTMQAFEKAAQAGQAPSPARAAEILQRFEGFESVLGSHAINPEGCIQTQATVKTIRNGAATAIPTP